MYRQKRKKESKQNTKDSHQITEESKEERSKELKNKKAINEMAISISTYLSIIILSINRLYAPIKRHRVAEWITKQDSFTHAAYKRLISKDTQTRPGGGPLGATTLPHCGSCVPVSCVL